jgi:hypothetical protein
MLSLVITTLHQAYMVGCDASGPDLLAVHHAASAALGVAVLGLLHHQLHVMYPDRACAALWITPTA